MKFINYFLLFNLLSCMSLYAQESKCIEEINSDIWSNFTKSFETLNHELFASLHREDFVRASGSSKSVKNKKDYIEGYKNMWSSSNPNQTINFRFLERFCNNESASERGIYKVTFNLNTDKEKSFYGEFHVILTNEGSKWKILVDYDTNFGNTSNEESYQAAFALDDFSKY